MANLVLGMLRKVSKRKKGTRVQRQTSELGSDSTEPFKPCLNWDFTITEKVSH